ncbi:MAG: acyltransferase [Caulobacteraceae bacterium]|nr:acyltransferase [Caulobacteraceae bacterium]
MGGKLVGVIRLILALAVVLSHMPGTGVAFISGGLAVQAFFVISGFYMALVLEGKYADRGLFYSNRLLRLAPTYLVMLLIAGVALFAFGVSATGTPELFTTAFSNPATAVVMGFENLLVVGQELLFWVRLEPDGGLVIDPSGPLPSETVTVGWQALLVPQSWSLSMELMFYALAPFLARMRWWALLGVALASIGLRYGGPQVLPVDYLLWAGRFFPTALFLFLMGMLAHRALPLAARAPRWIGVFLALGVAALLVLLPQAGLADEAARWTVYLGLAATTPFIFSAFRSVAWDRWIGELSYPLYLCHLFVVALVLTFNNGQPSLIVGVAASLALATLLVLLVEKPVDRWRQRRVASRATENPPVF